MSAGICKGCGASITWAKTREGKTIPLTRAKAYELDRPLFGHSLAAVELTAETYISHFLTCPNANKFSGKSKGPRRG